MMMVMKMKKKNNNNNNINNNTININNNCAMRASKHEGQIKLDPSWGQLLETSLGCQQNGRCLSELLTPPHD